MKERINGNLVNLNTATQDELSSMAEHAVSHIEALRNDLFLLDDYSIRRFGNVALEQPFEDTSNYELDFNLLDD